MTFDSVKIIEKNGNTVKRSKSILSSRSHTYYDLIDHANACLYHCQLLNDTIEKLEQASTSSSYFPIVIGRRPNQQKKQTPLQEDKGKSNQERLIC